ncbi:MAG TPA: methyl-accepting chemotaxis protein [Candidatus Acidoferrales bacterium]|nr:methyl-accepting chemotaxis protein [Candidatus Acidoferrales bacterium]
MTIAKKLYLGFGAILAIMMLLFVLGLLTETREHRTRSVAMTTLSDVQTIEGIRFQVLVEGLELRNYLLSGDVRDEDKVTKIHGDLMNLLREGETSARDTRLRATLAQVEEGEHAWMDNFAKPLIAKRHQVDAGDATVSDLQIFYLQQNPSAWMSKTSVLLDDASHVIGQALDESNASAASAAVWSTVATFVGILIAILMGIGIAYYTSLSITLPLSHLIKVAREIGDTGNMDQTIDIHRDDEVGQLAAYFNNMITHLKGMAALSASIAEGQLDVTVTPRSERDTLANAFARMVAGLHDIVRQVRNSAAQVADGSSQMANASDESAKVSIQAAAAIDEVTSTMHEMSINVQNVVKNTQVQASSVAETSASIEQMVTSIQRVADTAKVLLDIAYRSREEVHTGIATMEKTTDGLNRTNTAIQSSSHIIDALGRRADDIGKIVEVIDDLAEQTNLLALNAAIEAARAGEHGLGFAVVAEEVRKLAEKSTQSTKEISDLIEGIQKEARQAVENMEKSTAMVQDGLALGNDLNTALAKISNVVTEVYKFAQEIGAATTEQSNGSAQIAKATNRLTEITQEINSSVEEQASGAQAVVRAMEKMRELVQQSTSSSTQLAATAEQMSRLSHGLIKSTDRFQLSLNNNGEKRQPSSRLAGGQPAPRLSAERYAELVNS